MCGFLSADNIQFWIDLPSLTEAEREGMQLQADTVERMEQQDHEAEELHKKRKRKRVFEEASSSSRRKLSEGGKGGARYEE